MEYLNLLIQNCEEAKAAKPVREFRVTCLEDVPVIKKGIYIIREIGGSSERTFKDFAEFKAKKEKACCKANCPSEVLYVGSSTTGVNKRLRQHLITCPDKTYSLHLYQWFNGQYEITILEYDNSNDVIQLIEDSLSYDLKPAFGKQGGNNK